MAKLCSVFGDFSWIVISQTNACFTVSDGYHVSATIPVHIKHYALVICTKRVLLNMH